MDEKQKNNHKTRFPKSAIIVIAVLVVAAVIIYLVWNPGVTNQTDNTAATTDYAPATVADVTAGQMLSKSYCRSCHMYPSPDLLNRGKWKTLLPQMGLRLGIKEHRGEDYTTTIKDYTPPAKPALTDKQWQNILDFYMNTAPLKLPAQNRQVQITRELPFFTFKTPGDSFLGKQVLGSYVKIDNSVKPARIFVADGQSHKLFMLTNKLKVLDSINTTGPVVDLLFDKDKIWVCTIGRELGANIDKLGTITELKISPAGKMALNTKPIFDKLARPVQVLAADLNGDKNTDYLICEFGSLTGELSWMENKGDGTFTRHIISSLPGAIKAYFDYSTNKTTPDIWVLFAQGEEGIYHYTNNGSGQFQEKRILEFPPIYGSSFFELVDVNHDGYKDIVYTCGDNGNATLVLKPYHGVYVFLNDKHGNYIQKYFYPINGCYKAIARDFDGDGNIDIATISLFTDARQTDEGFVYLKNLGGLNFKPYALPLDTRFERAVTMDVGNLNGVGKPDLVIGNAYFDFGPFGYNIKESLFFILKNKQ
ncbi:MAG: VCBS repeat-containing protein [Bacteroidota bacterium]|nr:VCBS repeat-containing protein [Bacteroidota bacterium]